MKEVFDWKELLNFAEKIFAEHRSLSKIELKEEAACRVGISRAYYAAFHESKKCLCEVNPNFVDNTKEAAGSHDKVILGLKKLAGLYRKIGNTLEKIKGMRVIADYDDARYNKRGYDGNVVVELKKAITYAAEINTFIVRLRET